MVKIHKFIGYALLTVAAVLFVANFFNGRHLITMGCFYGIIGLCFLDSKEVKDSEIED